MVCLKKGLGEISFGREGGWFGRRGSRKEGFGKREHSGRGGVRKGGVREKGAFGKGRFRKGGFGQGGFGKGGGLGRVDLRKGTISATNPTSPL